MRCLNEESVTVRLNDGSIRTGVIYAKFKDIIMVRFSDGTDFFTRSVHRKG